jgi:hypothetical protein
LLKLLPKELLLKGKVVGEKILERESEGMGFDDEIRREIAQMAIDAESSRPIAMMLGIEERMIESWISFFKLGEGQENSSTGE